MVSQPAALGDTHNRLELPIGFRWTVETVSTTRGKVIDEIRVDNPTQEDFVRSCVQANVFRILNMIAAQQSDIAERAQEQTPSTPKEILKAFLKEKLEAPNPIAPTIENGEQMKLYDAIELMRWNGHALYWELFDFSETPESAIRTLPVLQSRFPLIGGMISQWIESETEFKRAATIAVREYRTAIELFVILHKREPLDLKIFETAKRQRYIKSIYRKLVNCYTSFA